MAAARAESGERGIRANGSRRERSGAVRVEGFRASESVLRLRQSVEPSPRLGERQPRPTMTSEGRSSTGRAKRSQERKLSMESPPPWMIRDNPCYDPNLIGSISLARVFSALVEAGKEVLTL